MRYTSHHYGQALSDLIDAQLPTGQIIDNFVNILKNNQQLHDWPNIEKRLRKIMQKKGSRNIEVVTAKELSSKRCAEIAQSGDTSDTFNFKISPQIIGGMIIKINDELLIDASFRKRINTLLT